MICIPAFGAGQQVSGLRVSNRNIGDGPRKRKLGDWNYVFGEEGNGVNYHRSGKRPLPFPAQIKVLPNFILPDKIIY